MKLGVKYFITYNEYRSCWYICQRCEFSFDDLEIIEEYQENPEKFIKDSFLEDIHSLEDVFVKGRLEPVKISNKFNVLIDYAYQGVAMENVL